MSVIKLLSSVDQKNVTPKNPIAIQERLMLIIKIARPRTWMFAVISYLFAYLEGESPKIWQITIGIVIFSILTGATNILNAYTDMQEDEINNPIRIKWIHTLGTNSLLKSSILIYSSVILMSLPFGVMFTTIIIIAVVDSISYSAPPIRLKRHPATALLAFSGAVGLPFLAGLAATSRLNLFNPWFLLFTLFMLTYGTIKNVPDFRGDQMAGLKTTATVFKSFKQAIKVNLVLLLAPYVLLIFFIGIGTLNKIYLLNVCLILFPIYWLYVNLQTSKRERLEKIHTKGFIYAISFYLFNFILNHFSSTSIALTASMMITIYIISKFRIDSRIPQH